MAVCMTLLLFKSFPNRFSTSTCKSLKAHVLQLVNEQLGRHSISPADSVSRNLLKFLTSAAGSSEMRLLVVQRIDGWIQNPKVENEDTLILKPAVYMYHSIVPRLFPPFEGTLCQRKRLLYKARGYCAKALILYSTCQNHLH